MAVSAKYRLLTVSRLSFAAFLGVALLLSGPVMPQEPPPFPEFTFKRVKPPPPGTKKRITVQITGPLWPPLPTPPVPSLPPSSDTDQPNTAPTADLDVALDWYWSEISPLLTRASPGRLDRAVRALADAPAGQTVATPRLASMRSIADEFGIDILRATVGTRVSPALALAVIAVESAGRPLAVSPAGAVGLMQLMPATAERFGVTNREVAPENIRGGVAYLDFLLNEFAFDPVLALAAYNAGEGAVMRNGGVPPFNETRAYVPKVIAAWTVARGLCITPPELVTDGCVFLRGSS